MNCPTEGFTGNANGAQNLRKRSLQILGRISKKLDNFSSPKLSISMKHIVLDRDRTFVPKRLKYNTCPNNEKSQWSQTASKSRLQNENEELSRPLSAKHEPSSYNSQKLLKQLDEMKKRLQQLEANQVQNKDKAQPSKLKKLKVRKEVVKKKHCRNANQ